MTLPSMLTIRSSCLLAVAYCEWAAAPPTEAEWEKAARGTNDTRRFPWGGGEVDCTLANYYQDEAGHCVGDTAAVGSYPEGASVYGALDMAGNVFEWVADWYQAGYYQASPDINPKGPLEGAYKVVRGGSWGDPSQYLRTPAAISTMPSWQRFIGFRCALSANP